LANKQPKAITQQTANGTVSRWPCSKTVIKFIVMLGDFGDNWEILEMQKHLTSHP